MTRMTQTEGTLAEGRAVQFREMMERLEALQARYKGVRGQLLAKVHEELMQLKPTSAPAATTPARLPPLQILPSCRACGRAMRPSGDGALVCQNGHTRLLAG